MEASKCTWLRGLFTAVFAAVLMAACWCVPALADEDVQENAAESSQFTGGNLSSRTADVVLGIADDATKAIDEVDRQAKEAAVVEKALEKARKESSSTDYFIAVDLAAKRTMVYATLFHGGNYLDFHQGALRQAGDADGGTGGQMLAERASVHFVESGELSDVGKEASCFHHMVEIGARRSQQASDILHDLGRLFLDGGADEFSGVGVERNLAACE